MENVARHLPAISRSHASVWQTVLGFLISADSAYRQHQAFKSLDAHLLADIGLNADGKRPL